MPPAVAAAIWPAIIGAGASTAGAVVAAKAAKNAAKTSAAAQTSAVEASTAASTKASEEALAFQREEAKRDQAKFEATNAINQANWEAAQHGNYDMYAARERRIGTVGEMMGLPAREIPAYRSSAAGSGGGSTADVDPKSIPQRPADLASAMKQANQIAYKGADKITAGGGTDWSKLWADDPDYTWKRMLGWQAGGNDVALAGPYAGMSAAAAPAVATAARPVAATTMVPVGTYLRRPLVSPGLQSTRPVGAFL